MNSDAYSLALKNALTEIRNICPDIRTSFLFDKEAAIVAGDAETSEATIKDVVGSLAGILSKADTMEGLNSLVVEANKGNVHIFYISDMYLTMITSKKADIKYVETTARVLIPTIIKLLDNLSYAPLKQQPPSQTWEPEEKISQEDKEEKKEEKEQEKNRKKPTLNMELPSNQLIVESFGGLWVRSDTVHISEDIMSQWEEATDGKEIILVEIESFDGKTSQCKVKTLDHSKLENKAIIRIPEKLCQTLNIEKGELVRVKPIIM
ncbi:MAG: hypothetical protein JSV51_02430 [Candidatus Bathyarchaeota archaeon]|nr:MAG: hypothetical protein JSV51_02430 [Candidatus Bathyarchaeota archaeon]